MKLVTYYPRRTKGLKSMRESVRKGQLLDEVRENSLLYFNDKFGHEVVKEWDYSKSPLLEEGFDILLDTKWRWYVMQN